MAYWMLLKLAERKEIKGLTKEGVEDLVFYLMLFSIIGGRLGHFIFFNPSVFWTNPLEILMVWHGGMAIQGGLIGAAIAVWIFQRKHKVKFYPIADYLVMPLSFFLFLGRIANFINGELWGTITNVSWCVNFPGVEGCRHPSQLYEAAKNLLIFGILYFYRNNKKLKEGVRFWGFILLYGILRFITNFWRDGGEAKIIGLSMGQILSIIMIMMAVYYLWKINRNDK